MKITFTEAAVAKLRPYLNESGKKLKLLHDTEGCGCVVSGVPVLQLVEELTADDVIAEGEPLSFVYEPRHEVYYEPHMRIDYQPAGNSFSLKSDNQIYTTNLRFVTQ